MRDGTLRRDCLRRGAGSMTCNTSRVVPSPTAAGATARRFRFVFQAGHTRAVRERRRLDIAEYLGNWVPLRIMAEQAVGNRCYLWVEAARPVEAKAAADYVQDCPAYVPGTFKVLHP